MHRERPLDVDGRMAVRSAHDQDQRRERGVLAQPLHTMPNARLRASVDDPTHTSDEEVDRRRV